MCALWQLQFVKRHFMVLNSEKIKPIVFLIIELYLAEGIGFFIIKTLQHKC